MVHSGRCIEVSKVMIGFLLFVLGLLIGAAMAVFCLALVMMGGDDDDEWRDD